ncbi:Monocarboxylate transporter 2 [Amphibalanus amphitrite]|uniref:Monocarboxylate transporter 2 n=1 Tax=Amphibalanus amphitrite TaxID=1232801 RepID=A0A6A4WA88_AMPAM|nr:Monocarboxylate transporter 2 [Amphibalanus amphitrite]
MVSVSNVLVVLPSYVTHLGYRRQQASLLLSVFAGCDLVGRVGGAALSDLRLLPRRAYLLACYLLSGAALAALPTAAAQYPAAGLAVALAGLATGGVMGLYSVMLIEYLGLERLGSSYGLSVCLSGVTLLAGPPLVGLLRQAAPSPHLVIYVLAALPFLAAAVWLAMPYAQRHVQRREAAVDV